MTLLASLFLGVGGAAFAQFETRASVSTGLFRPTGLAVGDFNRDGKLDVAVVSYLPTGNVMIFLGNGDGSFTAGASYAVAVEPFYVTAASLRDNGILDLVIGDALSDDAYVLLGNGDGTFQSPVPVPTSGESEAVSVGDFTGRGKLDLLALEGYNCNCVEVLPGNGDGTFGAPMTTPLPYSMSGYAMAVADFNGDGKLDVAFSGEELPNFQAAVLLGNGDGTFRADGYYLVSSFPQSVATGRFGGGRQIDLAVGNYQGNSISVLLGNGGGKFSQAVDYETSNPTWVAVGDLNGDGKEDLVASNADTPTNPFVGSVSVFAGNGDGTFQPGMAYPAGEFLNYVAIGDLNGDGKPDLVAVDRLGDAVITLLNTGVVSFSPTSPLTFPAQLLGTTGTPLIATLTNNGASPLTVSSVSYSGKPFQAQSNCKGSIVPGGNCTITATFTAETAGVTTGTVTLHDSASSKPQVVELMGTGTEVKFTPSQLNFGLQKVGTHSATKSFQVTNIGNSSFDFTYKIYVAGYGGNGYLGFHEANNCPTTLPAGGSCTVNLIFAPKQKGTVNAAVVFTDTGGGSPQDFPISGTGD
jgi:hypothetical protein